MASLGHLLARLPALRARPFARAGLHYSRGAKRMPRQASPGHDSSSLVRCHSPAPVGRLLHREEEAHASGKLPRTDEGFSRG